MKHLSLAIVFVLFAFHSLGQSNQRQHVMDSIRTKYLEMVALKNPMLRQAGISTETMAPGSSTSRLYGNALYKGQYQVSRATVYFNVPVVHVRKNIVSANFAASHSVMQLYDVTSYDPSREVNTQHVNNTLLKAGLSVTRIDSLFHLPVVYSVTATGLINPETNQHRLVFSGLMGLTVRRTANSALTIGLLVLLDPSAPTPIVPFISFYQKFRPGLELFFDPSRITLRKELGPRRSISFSNDIVGNLSLLKLDNSDLPARAAFTTLELKSGIMYEHLLTKKMVLTINAGVSSLLAAKMLEQDKNQDPFIKNKQNMVPYAKVGVSFLPFWKGIFQPHDRRSK